MYMMKNLSFEGIDAPTHIQNEILDEIEMYLTLFSLVLYANYAL